MFIGGGGGHSRALFCHDTIRGMDIIFRLELSANACSPQVNDEQKNESHWPTWVLCIYL